ncbi:nucleoside diphosphate kinase family protein, putative [Ichthyophthirius multifiliis]|uniref:Nucleoside diphosphate kinase family protein, putative n=1 Tax=Ichthyophthirius multifiliis TaxID=5932 RepID=G0R0J0_ICHMU|nr:nucleoside diphosphate kinase family protein, putative [Ichthyophthirius multifiliis]EGR29015.1 nucleoside diphosphate kinase family protein, putative [Ichthyophthirius multifiliis]|eukprot:XP_004030251.1 nucleoside diphosphate kinase family protein, putative [Ichthyophthirius multifiliis]
MIQRELLKQEAMNLFYKHQQMNYFQELVDYMISGESVVLLLCHETENPIEKWKRIIGKSDPEIAKKENMNCLRAIYGKNIIKNELHGSDNAFDSNKERDIFNFAVPQKIPEFYFQKMKVQIENLMKFLFPKNLEHANVNERLDMFAFYGPALNYHSVDQCLCIQCGKIGKDILDSAEKNKNKEEQKKMRISTQNIELMKKFEAKGTKIKKQKLQKGILQGNQRNRVLNEDQLIQIYTLLCEKCKTHCENFTHLFGGQNCLHVISDQELQYLAKQINKKDIHELLLIEKGNTADILIEKISLEEPKELNYKRQHIYRLFEQINSDYYNRYDFSDMQQIIIEDRRIRMNTWLSQIIGKSPQNFKNPKLIDPTVCYQQKKDVKNYNFTLERNLPLSIIEQKKSISNTPTMFPQSLVYKKKLQQNEENIAQFMKLHRHTTHVVSIDNIKQNSESYKLSIQLLRDSYNEGRHGSWNNYICLKQASKKSCTKIN